MFPDQPLDEVAQLVPGISELNIPLPPQAFTTKPFPKQWLAGHYLQRSRPSQWTIGPLPPGNRMNTPKHGTRNQTKPLPRGRNLTGLSGPPYVPLG